MEIQRINQETEDKDTGINLEMGLEAVRMDDSAQ
jgi:hypothetical protein